MSTQSLAQEAFDAIEATERSNGETFLRIKAGSPRWVQELIRDAAHDRAAVLPCDDRYGAATSALESIAYGDTPDSWDAIEPDCYTHDLLEWLQEPGALAECDEALDSGLDFDSMTAIIGYAQATQRERIRQAVYDWLEENGPSLDSDDVEDESVAV